MRRNTVPLNPAYAPNDISSACGQGDTLGCYDIYYITPWQGMNSPRVLLVLKTDFLRAGALEFIFAHAWRG